MEIRLEQIGKSYRGLVVLSEVSAVIREGVTVLMAPSGAGKTTLLRLILGLETPDCGWLIREGIRRQSAVFQEDRLLLHRTGLENLQFVQSGGWDRKRAIDLLERLGLGDAIYRPVREYSGGMRRRTALARALSVPFDLLVLDEPFAGLDDTSRLRCLTAVEEAAEHTMILLATHDLRDCRALDAEVILLPGI